MIVQLVLAWLAFLSVGPLVLFILFLCHSLKGALLGRRGAQAESMALQRLEVALAEATGDRDRYESHSKNLRCHTLSLKLS